jgi:hypothetical protein
MHCEWKQNNVSTILPFKKNKKILAGYIILEGKPSEHFRIDRG